MAGLTADIGFQLGRGAQTLGALQNQQVQRQQIQANQLAAQQAAAQQAQLAGLQGQILGGQQPVQPLGGQGPRLPVEQQQAQGIAAQQQLEQLFPEQAQATQQARKAKFDALGSRDKQRFESIANRFQSVQGLPVDQQIRMLETQSAQLRADNVPSEDTDEVLGLLKAGQIEQGQQLIDGAVETGQAAGILTAPAGTGTGGLASAKTEILADGTVIQALPDGTVDVRNPAGEVVTGQARVDAIQGSQQFREKALRAESAIAVEQARAVAGAKNRESRISAKKTEFSTRIQGAAREGVRLNAALNAAATATQGLTGALKVQLAKVFPDIDVSSEAALDQALGQLTIDQLQKFKGPTTDFEFAKSQLTVGALGDSKTANVARLKALQRNSWFVTRESQQFNRHIKDGGDVDNFAFNFNELIKTKRGNFTLRQLQDTAADANISIEETLKRLN
jgi:hypothetical protein